MKIREYIESKRARFIVTRIVKSIPVFFLASIIIFLIMHLSPGDPAEIMLGAGATEEAIESIQQRLGLDQPLYRQYLNYMSGVFQGDWGVSIRYNQPVLELIRTRMPLTLLLMGSGLIISVIMGITMGVLGALNPNSIFDYSSTVMALFWRSIPSFWLGILFLYVFALEFGWFPIGGWQGPISLVLPMMVIGLRLQAIIARLTRSQMLDVLTKDYIKSAKTKGLKRKAVIIKHGLRNALIPVVTVIALRVPWLFGGAVITETVFAYPGMGSMLVRGVLSRDFPLVQGIVLVICISAIIANLIADVSYTYIDPRIDIDSQRKG